MAKLYGTADSTLVSAAFKHGASNVPLDLSRVYKQRERNITDFATGITEMFDKIYADDKATMDLLTDNADKALTIMETGGMANEYYLGMHNDIVNEYKGRLKSIPKGRKGDLERSKLRSEMNRYLANIQSSEEMFNGMVVNSANSTLLGDLGDNKAELFNMIVEDYNNGTSKTQPKYVDGEIMYTLPGRMDKDNNPITMSMREINAGLSAYDPKHIGNIHAKLNQFIVRGKTSGKPMTAEDATRFKNELQNSMTNWDEIRNAAKATFGKMKYSFEEVLTGRAKDDPSQLEKIYTELEALGGADLDNDGDIDETDKNLLAKAKANGEIYTNAQNGFTLIDAVKKDKQTYRDLVTNYLVETAVTDLYGQGVGQSKTKVIKNGKTSNGLSLLRNNKSTELFGKGKGWTNNEILNTLGGSINDREDIPLAKGDGELIWDKIAKTYIYKPVSGENEIIDDKNSLLQTFFQSPDPISPTTVPPKWWNSIKDWGDTAVETTETPIKSLQDLKTAGIDKNIFMKPANDVIDDIKAVLPEGYDVITEASAFGKKGDWIPFFRSKDQFIVTDENGDKVGEFDTNYFKTPSKAIDELNRFFKILNEKGALNISTKISGILD